MSWRRAQEMLCRICASIFTRLPSSVWFRPGSAGRKPTTGSLLHDIRRIKAVRNLLASIVAIAANLFFLLRGTVHWPLALPMLLGAIVGGYAGGHLVRVLPANVVRGVVLTAGSVMSIVYAFEYWIRREVFETFNSDVFIVKENVFTGLLRHLSRLSVRQ